MPFFDPIRIGASGAVADFTVDRSLRFNDDDTPRINRTPSSSGNRQTWTKSFWIKRGQLMRTFLTAYYISGTDVAAIEFGDNHNLHFYDFYNGYRLYFITNRVFRDPSAWYHIVIALDTTQSTSSNRVKIYVNGEQETSFSTETYPSQNLNVSFNQNVLEAWGTEGTNQRLHFDGYMAEITYIDGLQLTPSSFGETNADTGQWNPIDTSGLTYGTNGYRLQFADNSGTSATTLGKDTSGNGNNWTPVNFGTGDAVKDTPTNNFCNILSIQKTAETTFFEGLLKATASNSHKTFYGNFGLRSGKWYWEGLAVAGSTTKWTYGVSDIENTKNTQVSGQNYLLAVSSGSPSDATYAFGDAVSIYNTDLYKNGSNVSSSYQTNPSAGDIIGIALDVDTGKVWFARNGTWINGSATASTTLNESSHDTTVATGKVYTPAFSAENVSWQTNFGQDSSFSNAKTAQGNTDGNTQGDFYYAVPSGFKAICSENLPEPTILKGDQYFDIATWTGNSGAQTISSLGFQPDLVWIKRREAENHFLTDSVRGAGKHLRTDSSVAENDDSATFTSFTSSGFTLTGSGPALPQVNTSGGTYVAWNWAAGTAFSNSAGSNSATIASSGSVNTTAGFSIVSYQGNATRDQLVYHGLNAAPKWFLVKRRDGDNWIMYHGESFDSNPQQYYYEFQNQDAVKGANDAFMWDDIVPDSNNFGIYSDGAVNNNGSDIIAWVWSEVAGFSKFGHFIGNGNSDGAYVHCGFTPRFVMVKNNNQGFNTVIQDTKRSTGNVRAKKLSPDNTDAEASANDSFDILSNGFKMRTSDAGTNASGSRYVFMAFASNPFKYARGI